MKHFKTFKDLEEKKTSQKEPMLFLLNKEPLPEDIYFVLSPEKDSLSALRWPPTCRAHLFPLDSQAGRLTAGLRRSEIGD